MKLLLTCFLLFLALNSNAQILELGYGPTSIEAGWGNLPNVHKFNASLLFGVAHHRSINYTPGVRYTFVNSTSRTATDEFGDSVKGRFNMLFLLPAAFNISLNRITILNRAGIGWSDESFPNGNGLRSNFILEAGIGYAFVKNISLSLRYSHISNGYRGPTNPGVDNITVATEIHF